MVGAMAVHLLLTGRALWGNGYIAVWESPYSAEGSVLTAQYYLTVTATSGGREQALVRDRLF